MSFGALFGKFMALKEEVDTETIGLLMKFIDRAMASGDPRLFLRGVLKAVVDAPEAGDGGVTVIECEVLPARRKRG